MQSLGFKEEEHGEEEETTLSWTSSMASLSPDNPLFRASASESAAVKPKAVLGEEAGAVAVESSASSRKNGIFDDEEDGAEPVTQQQQQEEDTNGADENQHKNTNTDIDLLPVDWKSSGAANAASSGSVNAANAIKEMASLFGTEDEPIPQQQQLDQLQTQIQSLLAPVQRPVDDDENKKHKEQTSPSAATKEATEQASAAAKDATEQTSASAAAKEATEQASAKEAAKQQLPAVGKSSKWQDHFDGHQDEEEATEDGDFPIDLEETTTANVNATNDTGMKMPVPPYDHHAPRPSPILEENPSTLEDDEESDQFPEEDQCLQPLLDDSFEKEEAANENRPSLGLGSRHRKPLSSSNLSGMLQPQFEDSPTLTASVSAGKLSPVGSPLRRGKARSYSGERQQQQQQASASTGSLTASSNGSDGSSSYDNSHFFQPLYTTTHIYASISRRLLPQHYAPLAAATWIGFWALLHVTCANYVLTPMRDAIALNIGVEHMPKLTLASTVLAFCSSVPIGWLFEAPDPNRRRLWKRMGLTRGETQGDSLALFYRCFAGILVSYAVGFQTIELLRANKVEDVPVIALAESVSHWWPDLKVLWVYLGQTLYIAFFLVVHLMKLHSLSLMWGVSTEAMEYEEVARKRSRIESTKTRLQRLALVGFGGTLGGILGSVLASSMARILRLPGLLVVAAFHLEISAELATELGRIMQKHWEEQQLFKSTDNLVSLDSSMIRSSSVGSMKRVASGNSLNRVKSNPDLLTNSAASQTDARINDDTFVQRLLRGVKTILRSRLLMAIFTYNALYASTTVLLSFQRAALVANRLETTTTEADTAFLANVNIVSSVAIFALQASGLGAFMATTCGPRGTLVLMPMIRLIGVLALAWWHQFSNGQPPNLLIFLFVDECTKIMNLAVAKPVRESLWRGLSNEARYEAKPIVDTLANRWGGGSAAFLVSFINRALDLFGVEASNNGGRLLFGFPPILVLCVIIAGWWAAVSADLGHIRARIDIELKKRL